MSFSEVFALQQDEQSLKYWQLKRIRFLAGSWHDCYEKKNKMRWLHSKPWASCYSEVQGRLFQCCRNCYGIPSLQVSWAWHQMTVVIVMLPDVSMEVNCSSKTQGSQLLAIRWGSRPMQPWIVCHSRCNGWGTFAQSIWLELGVSQDWCRYRTAMSSSLVRGPEEKRKARKERNNFPWLRENWSPGKPPNRMRAALLWERLGMVMLEVMRSCAWWRDFVSFAFTAPQLHIIWSIQPSIDLPKLIPMRQVWLPCT